MANTKVTKILMRNGVKRDWDLYDTVASLEIGEIGFESDTYRMKIGSTTDTVSSVLYKDLEYFAAGITSIQEVDSAHENGLVIDLDGKLELDIGNLVSRVDYHDTLFANLDDTISSINISIDTINAELERIEEEHNESIDSLIDSIKSYEDSITFNVDVSVRANTDSIEAILDSIADFEDNIIDLTDIKVNRTGDTMTGPLIFEGNGIIGTPQLSNIILTSGSTYVNNLLEPRRGIRIDGNIIETNDSYHAVSEKDIVDVKSLKEINVEINEPITKTLPSDGGYLFRSTSNPGRIGYRPSIPLKPAAYDAMTSLLALPADSVDADDLRDILLQFFTYIRDTGVLTANDQVVYEAD